MTHKNKKIVKNQKPTNIDVHLTYRCPNKVCGYDHWIKLNAAKTKNYKIVCDCGCVFKPKLIKTIKIIYVPNQKSIKVQNKSDQVDDENRYETYKPGYQNELEKVEPVEPNIPEQLITKATSVLIGYGFTKSESVILIKKAYINHPTEDTIELIRNILSNLEK